jgi:hypothetical protein
MAGLGIRKEVVKNDAGFGKVALAVLSKCQIFFPG